MISTAASAYDHDTCRYVIKLTRIRVAVGGLHVDGRREEYPEASGVHTCIWGESVVITTT